MGQLQGKARGLHIPVRKLVRQLLRVCEGVRSHLRFPPSATL